MRISSFFKKPVYSWMIFFSTLGVLSIGYSAFNALNLSDADTGKPLTSTMMKAVIENLSDLDGRVNTMSWAVSSLQVSAGNLWESVTGGIGYSGGNVGIGTTSPGSKLDISGETKSTSFTATDATSQSTTVGALKLNAGGWAIILDDAGQKRISWNDGGGNFNIRGGNYMQAGVGISYTKWASDNNGGAASITMNTDNADGSIHMSTATIWVPGTPVAWTNSLSLYATGSYFWNYVGAGVATPHAWLDVNQTFAIGGADINKWGIWTDGGNDNFGIAYIGGNYPTFSGPTHLSITKTGDVGITGTVTAAAFKWDGSQLTGLAGGVPAGAIMAFNLAACPSGWAEYTLARGRFLRGIDSTGTNDAVRVAGSIQADDFKSHTHTTYAVSGPYKWEANWWGGVLAAWQSWASGWTETRPKNVAVLYCVKS